MDPVNGIKAEGKGEKFNQNPEMRLSLSLNFNLNFVGLMIFAAKNHCLTLTRHENRTRNETIQHATYGQ